MDPGCCPLSSSCVVFLCHVNMQRDKSQGSTSADIYTLDGGLFMEKEITATGGWPQAEHPRPCCVPFMALILFPSTSKKYTSEFRKWSRDVQATYHLCTH